MHLCKEDKMIKMKAKLSIFIVFTLLLSLVSVAQEMIAKNDNGKLILEHKVSPKEGLFAIGRIYNVHPKDLADFNSIDINRGLSVLQVIKVPLTAANFSQSSSNGTPVYYKVAEKEGLYRVSINSNNVPVETIKKWNRLQSDNISVGTKLIVGYLQSGDPVQRVAKIEVKPEQKPTASLPVSEPVKTDAGTSLISGYGYFKNDFEQQVKNRPVSKDLTVTSGIFKTASGWQDGKYYVLIDDVDRGIIIRIINPSNNKMIYAKVLGEMSGIRQNQGLNIRISNAAASVLEISETDKFIVKVNYAP